MKRFTFAPHHTTMSDATASEYFSRVVASPTAAALYGIPVVIDRWMPDGFVAVVGPEKVGEMPDIVMLDLRTPT